MTDLEGKVAFVTGASRGIGAAVARALSNEGVAVGLASRSGDDLGLADALGLSCDVRHLDQVEAPSRRPSSASVASTSASRTPVSARTTLSRTRPSSTSRR